MLSLKGELKGRFYDWAVYSVGGCEVVYLSNQYVGEFDEVIGSRTYYDGRQDRTIKVPERVVLWMESL